MMPALALFEAGMLRSKNTLSLLTQIFSGVMMLSVMWLLFGELSCARTKGWVRGAGLTFVFFFFFFFCLFVSFGLGLCVVQVIHWCSGPRLAVSSAI
jgi:hypothetical protein